MKFRTPLYLRHCLSVLTLCLLTPGCGAASPALEVAKSPEPLAVSEEHSPPEELVEETAFSGVPSECSAGQSKCLPDAKWVDVLCEGVFPEVALSMFGRATPWQRMYLRRRTDAINASGGSTVAGRMPVGEEVLVLRHRVASSGDIQMGSPKGQYDALRWNGSCVSLEGGEISARRPGRVKHARVEWKWLGDEMRKALRKSDAITKAYRARRKECKGARSGSVTKKCERLDTAFSAELVRQIRAGLELPSPQQQP